MKYFLLSILSLSFGVFCYAQDSEFTADRPGLSDAPDIIKKGSWQIETGIDLSKYNHYGLWQIPSNTLRYSINKFLEPRLDFGGQFDPNRKTYGVSPFAIGSKVLITDQKKWIPQIAYIFEIYPPGFDSTQGSIGLGMELCINHDLKNDDNIYYNIGLNWNDMKTAAIVNALLGYNHEINYAWRVFGEIYFYSSKAKPNNFVADTGITWQMRNSLQLDFSVGMDIVKPQGNLYFEFGLSYNMN
jgi:hypothetical protein